MQNMPVTSAICVPQSGQAVKMSSTTHQQQRTVEVKGYAWSGGGQKIVRVDVTGDGGRTWQVAELDGEDLNQLPNGRNWSWMLWTVQVPVAADKVSGDEMEIWSKAVDASYNVQPETFENTWNLRGVLSHAYCRVKVKLA